MKLIIKLFCITLSSLCLSLCCAENKCNTDKIMQKSFSTGTPIDKQTVILKEYKRTQHIKTVQNCINTQLPVPTKIIFTADDDITDIALDHNHRLSYQALQASK